jgi:hypothetical protein
VNLKPLDQTINQTLREKLLELENGQRTTSEALTAIVQKLAKEDGVTVSIGSTTQTDWNTILEKLKKGK